MAGRRYFLIPLAALLASSLSAQTPVPGEAGAEKTAPPKREGWFAGKRKAERTAAANSPEFDYVRKAIDALTPEQRKRFQENFARWMNLAPDEKRSLRDRDEVRRKRMTDETESAATQAGLPLEGERRTKFSKRYAEERRKVEEQLRREMEEKRKPLVQEIIARLEAEFSEDAAATPAP